MVCASMLEDSSNGWVVVPRMASITTEDILCWMALFGGQMMARFKCYLDPLSSLSSHWTKKHTQKIYKKSNMVGVGWSLLDRRMLQLL